ncbi:isoleucine--tRNA ligase [Patescibacteria group bacterium]|nr:isoleucine--tRNA ligase [Patescibacteria group bacterium]
MFKPVDSKVRFSSLEEEILKFWKEKKIFEKSVSQRSIKNNYSFYDGPPFVTGSPHYGTLLSSLMKDLVARYQTMKGKRVRRVWGWDCHGLPIENAVEKKLGLKNRREIESLGIGKFVSECRKYVDETSSEWGWYVDHVGRWVDFENAYKTMDLSYMESVIWVFKRIYDKGLIYKGKRVSLFCPRCSTPISNFEIAMDNSYKDVKDQTATAEFALEKDNKKFILAWTTTPWTLPANTGLAVDEKEDYLEVKGKEKDKTYILAKKRLEAVFGKDYKILKTFKGKDLVGLSYKPLYAFFPKGKNDYKIWPADFVTMEDGTGVVHMAPGFGEEDTELGKKYSLSAFDAVDDEGKMKKEVSAWKGLYIGKVNPLIIEDLEKRDLLFDSGEIIHSYPFCYRCETPLIYKSQESWFINVQKIKKDLVKTNENIYWWPKHFKKGRFKKGIESAPDWCISRTRYWATAMPVWECECGEREVFGSIEEIEKRSGMKVIDLHRPAIDEIYFKCKSCSKEMRRVPFVLDCWMESGSMPYGQFHYPFENKEEFESSYPADFIAEYTGQLRAWFYVMHAISNALFGKECFKNVVVSGTLRGTDGRKMSKSYNNFPDPKEVLKNYGGDALRLYHFKSPLMNGEDMDITKGEEFFDQIKDVMLPLWNSYKFFILYANQYKFKPDLKIIESDNILDGWIWLRAKQFLSEFDGHLSKYKISHAVSLIQPFISDLSTWYIRGSRSRFSQGDAVALNTLYKVLELMIKTIAPVLPFIAEEIYQNLILTADPKACESVHLCDFPHYKKLEEKEREFLKDMELAREIASLAHSQRKEKGVRVRQPLKSLTITSLKTLTKEFEEVVKNEVNVKKIVWEKGQSLAVAFDFELTEELLEEGKTRDLIREIQALRKKNNCKLDEKINLIIPNFSLGEKHLDQIKKTVLAESIKIGSKLEIERNFK